jgi:hypothetical protein
MSALSWMPWYVFPMMLMGFLVPLVFLIRMLKGSVDRSRILARGIPATATILQIWETGVRINDCPQVGFQIQVMPPSGVPYTTQTTLVVSQLAIPRIQPGAVVPAKFDPANPNDVALEIG